MSRRLLPAIITVILLAAVIYGGVLAQQTVSASEAEDIIKEALETRWEVLVQGDITLLDELYSTQAQRAKHIEQVKLLKHRILPTWTRGYRYFEYTSEIEIESLQVARGSITATVKERVNLVWGQFRPFANTAGVSGVHNLHLVWERDQENCCRPIPGPVQVPSQP